MHYTGFEPVDRNLKAQQLKSREYSCTGHRPVRTVRSIRRRERPRTQERWLVDIRSLPLDFDKVDTTLGQILPLKLYPRTDVYR